jgi:solute carrier family 6 amino acid transporter-like protein 5/7/9/14
VARWPRPVLPTLPQVAYFTAIFPYVVLVTLLVRGLTLPGAIEGVLFYITPKWSELLNLKVWYAAVTQSFFSLSTGFGALCTYSSYNGFRHNSYRDALIISVADTLTSLLAGFVIFSILGNLAWELGVPVKDVVDSGPGLAFIR